MRRASLLTIAVIAGYLLLWPVAIEPLAWRAPADAGLTGIFAENRHLSELETIILKDTHGPEALAIKDSVIYASTREGWIVRYNENTGQTDQWVNTQGSPLGMVFDSDNNLIVADAYRGLLAISPSGQITVLTDHINGQPIAFADDLDIAEDGKIYFSDASSKFGAMAYGGPHGASMLDIIEHGGHGRLLMFDPQTNTTAVVMSGLNFANGVAIDSQSQFVLVNETGSYRIHKYWLRGPKAGSSELLIENLPGFPDNIVRGSNGHFWVGLVSPRIPVIDKLSSYPTVRKIIQRLPAFTRPDGTAYSHVFAIDQHGNVLTSLQDPEGQYPTTTGAIESEHWLYISSLDAPNLARISRDSASIP